MLLAFVGEKQKIGYHSIEVIEDNSESGDNLADRMFDQVKGKSHQDASQNRLMKDSRR